jgi:hypothetical protein
VLVAALIMTIIVLVAVTVAVLVAVLVLVIAVVARAAHAVHDVQHARINALPHIDKYQARVLAN